MLLILLYAAAYLIAGVVVDLFFEILMIHFGLGAGFDKVGRTLIYLFWPLILAWFFVSLVFGFINRLIELIIGAMKK